MSGTRQTQYINVNGVPTKILTWGKSLKDVTNDDEEDYIICIPGNPGITEFYTEFLEEVHKRTNHNVWIVGHAGHELIDSQNMPSREENKNLYSLQGQVKHKICFLENFVPKNAKIILIGHSIGSYIILKLVKVPSIRSRIVNNYLLFPTIENMAESINGKIFTKFLRHLMFLLLPLATFFNLLPLFLQYTLINIYCKISGIPNNFIDVIKNFIHPFTIDNVTSMALEEMIQVRERDNRALEDNLNSIKLYYGANDGWTPVSYYFNLKRDIPNIKAELCDKGFPHAFVLRDSKPMAAMIVEWMNT